MRQPQLKLLPICIGHLQLPELSAFGRCLGTLLRSQEGATLLVASSDMTHYESAAAARRKDEVALERILHLDAAGLYRQVCDLRISMCGVLPSVVMIEAAREMGAKTAELVRYGHSGEVTGDNAEVVGYAGLILR